MTASDIKLDPVIEAVRSDPSRPVLPAEPKSAGRARVDRPILFSAPMVRALLAGRKTQTRRALRPQPDPSFIEAEIRADSFTMRPAFLFGGPTWKLLSRITAPGDRLWVREAWRADVIHDEVPPRDIPPASDFWWEADRSSVRGLGAKPGKLRPGMFMPRWASRLTLTVTTVRVERLQEITDQDAMAEGIGPSARDSGRNGGGVRMWGWPGMDGIGFHTAGGAFDALWTSINGPNAWAANPWVAAISFTVDRRNIGEVLGRWT